MLLNIYQIYYDEKSKGNCLPETNHFFNKKCTAFFENEVILKLLNKNEHQKAEYFGVLSHLFQFKTLIGQNGIKPNYQGIEKFVKENKFDVISFKREVKNQPVFLQAERWHPGFCEIFNKIYFNMSGGTLPLEKMQFNKVVMTNHFIASPEYWDLYKSYLTIFINIMKYDDEIRQMLWRDSGYKMSKRRFEQNPKLVQDLGVNYYPFHPFILERLNTLVLHLHPEFSFTYF